MSDASDLRVENERLTAKVNALMAQLQAYEASAAAVGARPSPVEIVSREKIEKMSAEVVDTNPYSRLMALQRMGIVENYEAIRGCTVMIVGIGGKCPRHPSIIPLCTPSHVQL